MGGIKYYQLSKDEELPDEFCAVKDIGGEPSEYTFYVPEAENAKLRELAAGIGHLLFPLDVDYCAACPRDSINHPCPVYTVDGGECLYKTDLRKLGIEVQE